MEKNAVKPKPAEKKVKEGKAIKASGESQQPKPVSEQDVLDWILLYGQSSKKELSRKFNADKASLEGILAGLEARGLLTHKKTFWSIVYSFNSESTEGKAHASTFTPHAGVVGGERRFKTNIDVLKNLVDRLESVPVNKAAKFFNTDNETMMQWAKMLESHGLASIYYSLNGGALIVKKEGKLRAVNTSLRKFAAALFVILLVLVLIFLSKYAQGEIGAASRNLNANQLLNAIQNAPRG